MPDPHLAFHSNQVETEVSVSSKAGGVAAPVLPKGEKIRPLLFETLGEASDSSLSQLLPSVFCYIKGSPEL